MGMYPTSDAKKVLAVHTNSIDVIHSRDQKAPAATQADPQTVIDNDDI